MKSVPTWVWVVVAGFAALFYFARERASGGGFATSVGASAGPVGASAGVAALYGPSGRGEEAGSGESALFPSRVELPASLVEPGGDPGGGDAGQSYSGSPYTGAPDIVGPGGFDTSSQPVYTGAPDIVGPGGFDTSSQPVYQPAPGPTYTNVKISPPKV